MQIDAMEVVMDAQARTRNDVVVGVDGSPEGDAALRFAARYAQAMDASLRIVTAWEWVTFDGAPITYGQYDPRDEARRTAEEAAQLSGLPPERVSTLVDAGPPARLLVRASEGAQLLVVGCRGRGGFTGLLLGSVSTQCVHHAKCPVVVVRGETAATREAEAVATVSLPEPDAAATLAASPSAR